MKEMIKLREQFTYICGEDKYRCMIADHVDFNYFTVSACKIAKVFYIFTRTEWNYANWVHEVKVEKCIGTDRYIMPEYAKSLVENLIRDYHKQKSRQTKLKKEQANIKVIKTLHCGKEI